MMKEKKMSKITILIYSLLKSHINKKNNLIIIMNTEGRVQIHKY